MKQPVNPIDAGTQPPASRFDGTAAIFFEASKQATTREWDNIEQFNGPHHPLLGFYDYATRDTLLKQLHWIRRAGVDVLVYNMYAFDEWRITDAGKDRVLPWLLEALQDQRDEERKLQLVIYLEGYDYALPTLDEYRFGLDYIREHMSEHSFYFRHDGHPLVLFYYCELDAIAQMQSEYPEFTLRRVVPYGEATDWSYIQEWPQAPNPEWMPASPGIDSFMERCFLEQKKKGKPLDPGEISKMREAITAHERGDGEYFRKQLERAREVNPEIIFLSGWNDWQYGTQIEPAEEYEFMYVDLAAELLGRYEETASYRQ